MPPPPAFEGTVPPAQPASASVPSSSNGPAQQVPAPVRETTSALASSSEGLVHASASPAVAATSAIDQNSALSPNKRRGSPASRAPSLIPSTASQSEQDESLLAAKRSRPEEKPNKLLPSRYELCTVDDIVELIAHMVAELITTNDAIRVANGGLTRFHSRYVTLVRTVPAQFGRCALIRSQNGPWHLRSRLPPSIGKTCNSDASLVTGHGLLH